MNGLNHVYFMFYCFGCVTGTTRNSHSHAGKVLYLRQDMMIADLSNQLSQIRFVLALNITQPSDLVALSNY